MSNNRKTDEFLDLYKRLEAAAVKIVGPDTRGSVVFRLANHRAFADMKEELDYCRDVRNLLAHEVKVQGEFPVCPSDAMLRFMEQVLARIENPPRAMEHATPLEKLVIATPETPLLPLMREMRRLSISHVPLLDDGRVTGVFSVDTVFWSVLEDGGVGVDEETRVSRFQDYLPLNRHPANSFGFAAQDILLSDARDVFDRAYHRDRKMKMLFLTKNGRDTERLLAVLTPYDVLERKANDM